MTSIVIHLESRSGSGRGGKFRFAHSSNGHEAGGRKIPGKEEGGGGLSPGISEKFGDRGF